MIWLTVAALAHAQTTDEETTVPRLSEEEAQRVLSAEHPPPELPSVIPRHRSRGLLIGAALASATGAIAVGAAMDARRDYLSRPQGTQALYRTNQRFGYTGLALVGLGGGLTLGAVRLWEW